MKFETLKKKADEICREEHIFNGRVQGVGFRPFIYNTAQSLELTGFVQNTCKGVLVQVQGRRKILQDFHDTVLSGLPPLAFLESHEKSEIIPVEGEKSFLIAESTEKGKHVVILSPDIATCDDCLGELFNPINRRYLYPFINCTNCGPRYSITHSIPYDRSTTSMACFELCEKCAEEYKNPLDRRFHAQPNACPECGPNVWYLEKGESASYKDATIKDLEAIDKTLDDIMKGKIVAIKGMGGFHLACLAYDATAISELRQRKDRPHKPLALMVSSLKDAHSIAYLQKEETELIGSRERPIVLCQKKQGKLPHLIAPDTSYVGIMLPYTPLHHILLTRLKEKLIIKDINIPAALIMTSANRRGEPLCLGNREALDRLDFVADAFLLHNRDILVRVDDSVIRPISGLGNIMLRRARGYAPLPIHMARKEITPLVVAQDLPPKDPPVVLSVGAELKNTLAFTKNDFVFLSQHIGDLQNLETAVFHEEITAHLKKVLEVEPDFVACDMHPDYLSTQIAESYNLPIMKLQHHAAHAFAVMGENKIQGKALVIALDGTGYGEDGKLWGGEAIIVNTVNGEYARVGTLSPLALPGGEAAIKEPWRIAHGFLAWKESLNKKKLEKLERPVRNPRSANEPEKKDLMAHLPWLPAYEETAKHIPDMIEKGLNSPYSSSAGRLFDAVSALLGVCLKISYEGQAAIKLEEAALGHPGEIRRIFKKLPCTLAKKDGLYILDTHELLMEINNYRLLGVSQNILAKAFHESFIFALTQMAREICIEYHINYVGMAGGCFNNALLYHGLHYSLKGIGLQPFAHLELPPGDGSIAYGQALWASLKLRNANQD